MLNVFTQTIHACNFLTQVHGKQGCRTRCEWDFHDMVVDISVLGAEEIRVADLDPNQLFFTWAGRRVLADFHDRSAILEKLRFLTSPQRSLEHLKNLIW